MHIIRPVMNMCLGACRKVVCILVNNQNQNFKTTNKIKTNETNKHLFAHFITKKLKFIKLSAVFFSIMKSLVLSKG